MIKDIFAPLLFLLVTLAFSTGAHADSWISQIGGKGADVPAAVIETSDNRICTTGTFWSSADFAEGEHRVTLATEEAQDIFVACYSASGDLQFAKRFGARRGDEPRALATLPGGDLLVAGMFSRELGTSAPTRLKSNGNSDIFVIRINSEGDVVWSRQYGGKLADSANSLAVSDSGDIYLAGSFESILLYRSGGKTPKVNSAGARDAVVLKLSESGDVQWVQRFGGKGYDSAARLTVRANDDVLIAGTFQKTVQFDQTQLVSRGFKDVFLVSLSSAGELNWVQQLGGEAQDNVSGVVEDGLNRIHVVGDFQKSIVISPRIKLTSQGSADIYVARYSANGEPEQAHSIGGKHIDQVFALATTDDNGLVLTGHYQGEPDMAPGPDVYQLQSPSKANSSGFLLALDQAGYFVGSRIIGGDGVEMVLGLDLLQSGDVAVVGLFNNNVVVPSLKTLDRRGKTDVFVARMTVPEGATSSANLSSVD